MELLEIERQLFFLVVAMSRLFRGKLLATIQPEYKQGNLNLSPQLAADYKHIKNKLYKKEFVKSNCTHFDNTRKKHSAGQIKYSNIWADIHTKYVSVIIEFLMYLRPMLL